MTTILQRESRMPSLAGATEWLNSQMLTPAELQGRVVLIDFGTYTCINWLRTLPQFEFFINAPTADPNFKLRHDGADPICGDSTGSPGDRRATVKVELHEQVTCTFTNKRNP